MLRALWRYRNFVGNMVAREFRGRYVNSLLGMLWAVLTPLATILIYLLVFSGVMRGRLPGRGDALDYGIYLCTGILIWGFFSEVLNRCLVVFLEYANLIKKLSFPRITLPVIVLLTSVLNFALVAALFALLLLAVGRFPGAPLLALLPLLALQQTLAVGLGILLGTVNVFFRDIGQAMAVLLNLWFWATPIVYHVDILPEEARPLLAANPLTALFASYQRVVLAGEWPDWRSLGYPLAAALVAVVLGLFTFRRLSGEMVDEL